MTENWSWDPSLYAGSAAYYPVGRLPYPAAIADALTAELRLDGTGRLLDVGCGPGSLTLVLAGLFEESVGVDADADMLEEARRQAAARGCRGCRWVHLRAEELPAGLGQFRIVTLAQSFHWMDQPRVAATLRDMIALGGALVHVGATTHQGVADAGELPGPRPPRQRIHELVASYLGSVRRGGVGQLPSGHPQSGENGVFAAAGFSGPKEIKVGGGQTFRRSEDEIVASVFSLSSAAPHLFGDRIGDFERELRELLRRHSPTGEFWECSREITLSVWWPAP